MMFYYDGGTGMHVYPMEETLFKEYIKCQIEYFFSIEILEWDFFLRRKMDEQGKGWASPLEKTFTIMM